MRAIVDSSARTRAGACALAEDSHAAQAAPGSMNAPASIAAAIAKRGMLIIVLQLETEFE
jgi:hypothetical protein